MDDKAMDVELSLWEAQQAPWERADPLWSLIAYRLARFVLDQVREDLRGLGTRVSLVTRDQVLRSAASISANIGEGYSRPSARERARFYGFALGSAREAVSWYASIAHLLPGGAVAARMAVFARLRRLLLGLLRRASDQRWHSRAG
jgi:four helix bundle protein